MQPVCDVRIVKVRALLTRFQCRCTCGWTSPLTTKQKAAVGREVHLGGGEIVSWTKKRPTQH